MSEPVYFLAYNYACLSSLLLRACANDCCCFFSSLSDAQHPCWTILSTQALNDWKTAATTWWLVCRWAPPNAFHNFYARRTIHRYPRASLLPAVSWEWRWTDLPPPSLSPRTRALVSRLCAKFSLSFSHPKIWRARQWADFYHVYYYRFARIYIRFLIFSKYI